VGGALIITGTFQAQKTGTDFGSGAETRCFVTQGGITTFGGVQALSNIRSQQTIRHVFVIEGGEPIVCGLFGAVTGATLASWWDIAFTAEHIKR